MSTHYTYFHGQCLLNHHFAPTPGDVVIMAARDLELHLPNEHKAEVASGSLLFFAPEVVSVDAAIDRIYVGPTSLSSCRTALATALGLDATRKLTKEEEETVDAWLAENTTAGVRYRADIDAAHPRTGLLNLIGTGAFRHPAALN